MRWAPTAAQGPPALSFSHCEPFLPRHSMHTRSTKQKTAAPHTCTRGAHMHTRSTKQKNAAPHTCAREAQQVRRNTPPKRRKAASLRQSAANKWCSVMVVHSPVTACLYEEVRIVPGLQTILYTQQLGTLSSDPAPGVNNITGISRVMLVLTHTASGWCSPPSLYGHVPHVLILFRHKMVCKPQHET